MKHKLLGCYNYTVVLTYIGMLSGFMGITLTLDGDIHAAMICLMVAGICDMFDGAIASTRKRNADEKCFGIQIDSLSDFLCFGILPALLVYRLNQGTEVVYAVSALYVLSALVRLAYFNVDEQNRQKISEGSREFYLGLPVTTITIILPLTMFIENALLLKKGTLSFAAIVIAGVLFLLPFQLKKPKLIGKLAMGLCGVFEFTLLVMAIGDI